MSVQHFRQFGCDVYPVWPPEPASRAKLNLRVQCESCAASRRFVEELRIWAAGIAQHDCPTARHIRVPWTFASAVLESEPDRELVVCVECPDAAALAAFAAELQNWATFIEGYYGDNDVEEA